MPYAVAGQCYATTADALVGFQKAFPLLGDANLTSHVSSSITASGLVTYSLSTRPITTNTVSSRTGTIQLANCVTVDYSPFDPIVAGGVFALFFAGVVSSWVVAQNIGLILEAVRKW